jgi:hypothetical protein
LGEVKFKAFSETFKHSVAALEARKVKPRNHSHFNERNDFFSVLPQTYETLDHQFLEFLEPFGVGASHDIDILLCQLKCNCFEIHVPWRVGQHEAEVNMHNVSLSIQ